MQVVQLNGFQLLQLLGEVDHHADTVVEIQQPPADPRNPNQTMHTLARRQGGKWMYLAPTGKALHEFVEASTPQPKEATSALQANLGLPETRGPQSLEPNPHFPFVGVVIHDPDDGIVDYRNMQQ